MRISFTLGPNVTPDLWISRPERGSRTVTSGGAPTRSLIRSRCLLVRSHWVHEAGGPAALGGGDALASPASGRPAAARGAPSSAPGVHQCEGRLRVPAGTPDPRPGSGERPARIRKGCQTGA